MSRLRLSIAVCTYEGAAFLPAQLATIAAQTRPPDEVVVCDDGSTDGTLDLLGAFAADAPFPVHVHVGGPAPVGPAKNFERAVGLATGDVIVLADQDDTWARDRLARAEAAYTADPEVLAVFGDADLVDEHDRLLGESLWQALGITGRLERTFRDADAPTRVVLLCQGNLVTGATLSFRAACRSLLLPVPEGWLHDHWFGVMLSASGPVRMERERLVQYRIHDLQHTGIGNVAMTRSERMRYHLQLRRRLRKNERATFDEQVRATGMILERLEDRGIDDATAAALVAPLRERQHHLATRAAMPDRRHRLVPVGRELVTGRYHRHSSGTLGALKDLLLVDARARPEEQR